MLGRVARENRKIILVSLNLFIYFRETDTISLLSKQILINLDIDVRNNNFILISFCSTVDNSKSLEIF